jgi:hypothetical protein
VFENLVNIVYGMGGNERALSVFLTAIINQTAQVRGAKMIEFEAGGVHQSGRYGISMSF